MTHTLVRTTVLPADLVRVFDVFKNPRNLEALTPPWLSFRILSTTDEIVRGGTRIRYRLSLAGVPISWESRITEYAELSHFADEQLKGPYRRWYHRHTFRAVPGGVEMTDAVEYALPFGPLGRLVHWLIVRHQLRAIFDYRTKVMTEMFGGTPASVAAFATALETGG
ncbi:MAG: SRPBCC family protein [Gemmatimonadales bacterium]|nr:SRPBCC family protein [Gemmatimonadales bacterium]